MKSKGSSPKLQLQTKETTRAASAPAKSDADAHDQPTAPLLEATQRAQSSSAAASGSAAGHARSAPAAASERKPAPKRQKAEHANSRAQRRGPMDEMRQLLRVLVCILPHSKRHVEKTDDDSGGNKVSEQVIKNYLDATLGEAPKPDWGLENGWGLYVAGLFNWALGEERVTADQARACISRRTGCAWEAQWRDIYDMGIYSDDWAVPLSRNGIAVAQQNGPAQKEAKLAALDQRPKRARRPNPAYQETDAKQVKRATSSSEEHLEHPAPGQRQQAGPWPAAAGGSNLAGMAPAQLVGVVAQASALLRQHQPTLTAAQTAQMQQSVANLIHVAPQAYQDAICAKLGHRLDSLEGKLDAQAGAFMRWPTHGALSNANLVNGSPLRHQGAGLLHGSPTRDALAPPQATSSPSLWKAPEQNALAAAKPEAPAGVRQTRAMAGAQAGTRAQGASAAHAAAAEADAQGALAGAHQLAVKAGSGDMDSPAQEAVDANADSQADRSYQEHYGINSQPAKGMDSQDFMAALLPSCDTLLGGSQLLALPTQQATQFDSQGNIQSQQNLSQVFN